MTDARTDPGRRTVQDQEFDIDEVDLDIGVDDALSPADERAADRLVDLAVDLSLDSIDLFDDVHDAASLHASDACNDLGVADDPFGDALHEVAGRQAADVNNHGLDRQVRYLVSQFGAGATEEIIRRAAAAV